MNATYTAALEALEVRRGLVAAGRDNLGEDVVDLDPSLRRTIEQEGTCDGCAEGKSLVLAVDLPDSEPWLCRDCADYDALIVAMHADYPRLLDALAGVLERHADGGRSQGYGDDGYGYIDHCCETCGSFGEYGVEWPCSDALAALAALGVEAN